MRLRTIACRGPALLELDLLTDPSKARERVYALSHHGSDGTRLSVSAVWRKRFEREVKQVQ